MSEGKLSIAALKQFEIDDESIYMATVEELRAQAKSVPTSLLTMMVTRRIVGPDRYAEGSLVSTAKLYRLLRRAENAGIVHAVRGSGREVKWMHIDAWRTHQARLEEEYAARAAQRKATFELRARFERAGFNPQGVTDVQVYLSRADAERLLTIVEGAK